MVLKSCRRWWQCCLFVGLMAGSLSPVHAGSYEDFFSAIDRDDGAAVAALIERGFDANSRSPDGQCGLYLALQKEADAALAALLKAKDLNVNLLNVNGESALMIAALKGNLEGTQKLLLRGAQVNKPGWTPLHYAASGQQPKVVSLLLDNGALIDAQSPNGTTALMMAARYGDEGNVRVLTLRQADGRLKNQQGLDAAAFARLAGREALAKSIEQRYR
ncbi:MAG: ankyrin repeat domain-containing protein [Pseudomonadota bacterium]